MQVLLDQEPVDLQLLPGLGDILFLALLLLLFRGLVQLLQKQFLSPLQLLQGSWLQVRGCLHIV